MSKFDEYKKAKACAEQARAWYSLLGKKYYGGTRGQGELGRIVSTEASITIYYQHSDGDKNYHQSPEALNRELAAVLKRRQKELVEEALAALEANEKSAARQAAEEYQGLLAAAGVDYPSDVSAAAGGLTQVAIER